MPNGPAVAEMEPEDDFDPSQNPDLVAMRDAFNGDLDDRFGWALSDGLEAIGEPTPEEIDDWASLALDYDGNPS